MVAKKIAKKSVKAQKKDPAEDFEILREKLKGKKSVRYRMSESFETDDVIDHDKFGKGIVIGINNNKIDVVFSDKLRILVCNR